MRHLRIRPLRAALTPHEKQPYDESNRAGDQGGKLNAGNHFLAISSSIPSIRRKPATPRIGATFSRVKDWCCKAKSSEGRTRGIVAIPCRDEPSDALLFKL